MPTRINKKQARKLYDAGKAFYILACNLCFSNVWQSPFLVENDSSYNEPFDKLVNMYEFYNCDKQRGKYAAFYVN